MTASASGCRNYCSGRRRKIRKVKKSSCPQKLRAEKFPGMLLFTFRYETGVAFFCAAMYVFILRNGTNKLFLIPPVAFLLIFAVNKTGIPSVYLLYACLFYYHIFILYKLKRTEIFLSFIPFALCDILVAANYISPSQIIRPFIWIFYGMSQILIFTGSIQKKQCILHYRQH